MPAELEICIACDHLDEAMWNAEAAVRGGADRLECCADMSAGGLTPSLDIIEAISRSFAEHVVILVMIRPRDGSFEWSPQEANLMLHSIGTMAAAGAHGIVSGALGQGRMERELTRKLISAAHRAGLSFTFHRAIDASADRFSDLKQLMHMGCNRVLTAGTPWDSGLGAVDGLKALMTMARLLGGNRLSTTMEMVIGGGIAAHTLPELFRAFGGTKNISFHAFSSVLERGRTDTHLVRQLRTVLDEAHNGGLSA